MTLLAGIFNSQKTSRTRSRSFFAESSLPARQYLGQCVVIKHRYVHMGGNEGWIREPGMDVSRHNTVKRRLFCENLMILR